MTKTIIGNLRSAEHRKRNIANAAILALLISIICNIAIVSGGIKHLNSIGNFRQSISLEQAYGDNTIQENGYWKTTGADPKLIIPSINDHISYLTIKATVNKATYATIYYSKDSDNFDENHSLLIHLNKGSNEHTLPVISYVSYLRIDFGYNKGIVVNNLQLLNQGFFTIGGSHYVFCIRLILGTILLFFILLHILVPIELLYKVLFRYRFLIGIGIVSFAVIFNLNGSSIATWKDIVSDNTLSTAVGKYRYVRTDEWNVWTPMMLSQQYGKHPWSWYNSIIRGESTDVFMLYALPVKSPAIIFRPFLIGFLIFGAERGLAFFWSARAVCTFLSVFELLRIVTKDKRGLSASGAAFILFSQIVQWWFAINSLCEMLIFGSLFLIAFTNFLSFTKIRGKIGCATIMSWSAGAYIMTMYPSWMVPLAYVFLAILIWIIIEFRPSKIDKRDLMILVSAAVVTIGCIGFILYHSLDTIKAVMNTAYPGQRVEHGNFQMFRYALYPGGIWGAYKDTGMPTNVCEMATIYDLFPVGSLLGIIALVKSIQRKRTDWLLVISFILVIFLDIYCVHGIQSNLIVKLSLLSFSQANRAMLGVWMFHFLILFRSMSDLRDYGVRKGKINVFSLPNILQISILLVIAILVTYFSSVGYQGYLHGKKLVVSFVILVIAFIFVWFYDRIQKKNIVEMYLAAIIIISGIGVNPIQIGLGGLYKTNLAEEVQNITARDSDAEWVVTFKDSTIMDNYPIMFGAKTINSVNIYPAIDRWRKLDPEKKFDGIYNRYAFIKIKIGDFSGDRFTAEQTDNITVRLTNKELLDLGAKYILTDVKMEKYNDDYASYQLLFRDSGKYIYIISANK
jgi:hypothetical protein